MTDYYSAKTIIYRNSFQTSLLPITTIKIMQFDQVKSGHEPARSRTDDRCKQRKIEPPSDRMRPCGQPRREPRERPYHDRFECLFCCATFSGRQELKFHLEENHSKSSEMKVATSEKRFQCCICALKLDTKIVLGQHLRIVHTLEAGIVEEIVREMCSEDKRDSFARQDRPQDMLDQRRNYKQESQIIVPDEVDDHPPGEDDKLPALDDKFRVKEDNLSAMDFVSDDDDDDDEDSHRDNSGFSSREEIILFKHGQVRSVKNKFKKVKKGFESGTECKKCFEKFHTGLDFHSHVLASHSKEQSCLLCLKTFSRASDMLKHLLCIHGVGLPLSKRPNQHRRSLSRNSTQDNIIECKKCPKKFAATGRDFFGHVLVSHPTETSCLTCLRSFSRRSNMLRHLKDKHGAGNVNQMFCVYKCGDCGLEVQKSELSFHRKICSRGEIKIELIESRDEQNQTGNAEISIQHDKIVDDRTIHSDSMSKNKFDDGAKENLDKCNYEAPSALDMKVEVSLNHDQLLSDNRTLYSRKIEVPKGQ